LAPPAVALLLALASSAVAGTRMETQEWDCPPPQASCARPVPVRGFPRPYVSDDVGISVVGRASLLGAAIGEDRFHRGAFLANVAIYLAVAAGARIAARRVVGARRQRP
jgi:hypothetical protein